MDALQHESLLDLKAEAAPHRYSLQLRQDICGGPPERQFLFGGAALGAAIAALESSCARPVAWATAQYVSFARLPSTVTFEVEPLVEGRETSQARVKALVEDREIICVSAALGARSGDERHIWLAAPDAPPPEACPPMEGLRRHWNNLPNQFDRRIAPVASIADSPGGRHLMWVRHKHGFAVDRPMLAVIADFVSEGLRPNLGENAFGNSLDNTIRFVDSAPTDWVLCDIRIQSVTNGLVHGAMHLFSEDGVLLAIASQTLILRLRPPHGAH